MVSGDCWDFLALYLSQKKKLICILIGILLVGIISYSFFPSETKTNWRLDFFNLSKTSVARILVWKDSLTMVRERPFFGHGINTFMMLFPAYQSLPSFTNLRP